MVSALYMEGNFGEDAVGESSEMAPIPAFDNLHSGIRQGKLHIWDKVLGPEPSHV